jgi:hypothetical protein
MMRATGPARARRRSPGEFLTMTTALLLTLVALLACCLIRYPARGETAHPAEGYLFGDPASPTRAERERMLEVATA